MFKKLNLFALSFLLCSSFIAAQSIPEGFSKVKEASGITEYKLDSNGLSVLTMEDHSAPVTTFMVTFHVGSRNEVTGTTGATHLLEHLMFKGTPEFNKAKGNNVDVVLGNLGARINATTWNDRTNYFESIPSNYLELAVQIEADRMHNLSLKKEDKDAEMTVVRNEYERGENDPSNALDVAVWASAFIAHPYHHPTIGWKSDIENVPMAKLRAFYNTFYWPNNATVTIIGDFKTYDALSLVKKYYGSIPSSPNPIPQLYTVEPKQQGERRTIVRRAGQVGVVEIGFKIPETVNKASYTLSVLDNILTEGKTSLLYKALIDKNLAVNVFDGYFKFHDPSLFTIFAYLAPGVKHEDVEKAINDVMDNIKTNGVTKEEVNRAINQINASTVFGRDGSFSIASQLNEAIAAGDWTYYATYLDNIKKVTPEDVQTAVKEYYQDNSKTVGYFIPESKGGDNNSAMGSAQRERNFGKVYYRDPNNPELPNVEQDELNASKTVSALPDETSISGNITRKKVAGIDVILAKTGVKDMISFRGSLPAGDYFSGEKNAAVADLTGYMLDKGTTKNDKFALADKLGNLGASINFSVGKLTLTFSGQCLTKDINTVIGLLAEQLRSPAFSKDEFEKLKVQRKGSLKQAMESTNFRASEALNDMLFPKGHPNYDVPVQQLIDDIDKVTLEDVKAFYKKYYGPKSMIFVAAGDLDPKAIENSIDENFKGWSGGVSYPKVDKAKMVTEGKKQVVMMADKTSTTLMIGQTTGLKRTDKDFLPLSIANSIFGLGGFAARLMSIIRDDEGLTYGIYSFLQDDTYNDGSWAIRGTFAPTLLDKGIASTVRELKRWVKDGVTEKELEAAKTRNIGSYKVGLATTRGMASNILSFAQAGFDMKYMDEYPEDIEELTLDQVNKIIKKYIDPDKVDTVIAGTVKEDTK